jgi:hypothetical protein
MTLGPRDLVIIECCASKLEDGVQRPAVSIAKFLPSDAWKRLKKTRHRVFKSSEFKSKGVKLDRTSPPMRLLGRYKGHLYGAAFKRRVCRLLKRGVRVLIMSGGFGLAHPYEHTHWYEAKTDVTGSLWRTKLPSILRDYIRRNDTERVFIAGSSKYVDVLRAAGRLANWANNVRVYAYSHSVPDENGQGSHYRQFGLRLARAVRALGKGTRVDPKFWKLLQ